MIEAGPGLAVSFGAGVVSFLSPCILPLVPGYVSYIAGQQNAQPGESQARLKVLVLSAFFVLGFSSVFMLLGASATALGRLLMQYRYEANIVGGAIVIFFGLFAMGLVKPTWFLRELRMHPSIEGGKPLAAYLLGLAFAFGWTPCVGPILGAILTLSAVSSNGVALLGAYSLGLAIPFLAAAALTGRLVAPFSALKRLGRLVYSASGAIMVVTGVAMLSGQLQGFSFWLLDLFPALGKMG